MSPFIDSGRFVRDSFVNGIFSLATWEFLALNGSFALKPAVGGEQTTNVSSGSRRLVGERQLTGSEYPAAAFRR